MIKRVIDYMTLQNNFREYMPFFRVIVCLFILRNIYVSMPYAHLLFEAESFLPHANSPFIDLFGIDTASLRENYQFFQYGFIILVLLYLVGIGKNGTAFLVFFGLEIFQRLNQFILNGGDNLLKFAVLYLIFANSFERFSYTPLKPKKESTRQILNFSSNLAGLSLCFHICLVYLATVTHKIHADVWFNGLATYYTLSLERFQGTPFNKILADNGVFVTLSTYFTLLIEALFPILVWFRSTKWIMLFLGICLHLGIFVTMMIYDFQLIFISFYGLFLSNKDWQKIFSFFEKLKQGIFQSRVFSHLPK